MWLALGQGQVDRRRKVHLYESPPVFKLPPGSSIDDMRKVCFIDSHIIILIIIIITVTTIITNHQSPSSTSSSPTITTSSSPSKTMEAIPNYSICGELVAQGGHCAHSTGLNLSETQSRHRQDDNQHGGDTTAACTTS